MRDGRARICVATDVAARGIDLPNLDLVIHADIPTNPDTLLHRSGRTGRAGRKGICTLIVPFHRRGAASRVLKLAKLQAQIVTAPTVSDIEHHNRQRILDDPALSVAPGEDEIGFIEELMAAHGAERIAAAYLRLQLAARPAPEELSDAPVHLSSRDDRPEPRARSDFDNGVWFRVSVGRKQRAEPRWLLPMICKAGGITKRGVGSIRIGDTDSQFEITRDKADQFWARIEQNGTGEKGVTIERLEGAPPSSDFSRPTEPGRTKPKFKSKSNASFGAADRKPKKPHRKNAKKQP
jgi:ATP-dependent RNA helicase DeaD